MTGEPPAASGDPRADEVTPTLKTLLSDALLPKGVRRDSWSLGHTFYLGEIAVFLVAILFATGPLLMVRYTPTPERAHESVAAIASRVPFGALVRGAHFAAAYGLIGALFLHMVRVFYAAAYKGGRRFGWHAGVALLVLFAAQSYTGYLLPWDQTGYWGTVVGTNIASYAPVLGGHVRTLLLGGDEVGAPTLLRFYVLHVAVLPLAAVAVLVAHFYSLRKAGLSAPAERARPQEGVHSRPEVALKMTAIFLATLLAVLVAAAVFRAPLEGPADPGTTPNPARAPWFVSGLQELVHYSAFLGGVAAPTVLILFLVALPWLDAGPGRRARDRRAVLAAGTVLLAGFLLVTVIGNFFRGPGWAWRWPWAG